jgi:hypothetical protein
LNLADSTKVAGMGSKKGVCIISRPGQDNESCLANFPREFEYELFVKHCIGRRRH